MIMLQNFFGSGNYSIVGPYMGEMWPSRLRGSGMGLVYGVGNLGKFIGPAGLALIAGSSNFVKPQATLDALIPASTTSPSGTCSALLAFWFIGFETRGRTIDEIDRSLDGPRSSAHAAQQGAGASEIRRLREEQFAGVARTAKVRSNKKKPLGPLRHATEEHGRDSGDRDSWSSRSG